MVLREFGGKSDAAFGGCVFFDGSLAKACHPWECVTYGETLLLAGSKQSSYGKMVPLRHPMVKPYRKVYTVLVLKPGGCYMLTCSAPPGLHTTTITKMSRHTMPSDSASDPQCTMTKMTWRLG